MAKLPVMGFDHIATELPWPFSRYYKEEEMMDYLESLGFKTSIPEVFIKVFNGEDEDINLLKNFVSETSKKRVRTKK